VGAVVGGVVATMWGYSQMFLTFSLLLIVAVILYFFTGMKRDKTGNNKGTVINP
jgi:predicted MFS family arabinose efflux permease